MIYLIQVRCPNNHFILVGACEAESEAQALSISETHWNSYQRAVRRGRLRDYCGICRSKDLRMEVIPTPFKTRTEARDPVLEEQRRQHAIAEYLDESKN